MLEGLTGKPGQVEDNTSSQMCREWGYEDGTARCGRVSKEA